MNFSSNWALATNLSMETFGVTLGGEFSGATNDCGLWLGYDFSRLFMRSLKERAWLTEFRRVNGIEAITRYPNCTVWNDWTVSDLDSLLELTHQLSGYPVMGCHHNC